MKAAAPLIEGTVLVGVRPSALNEKAERLRGRSRPATIKGNCLRKVGDSARPKDALIVLVSSRNGK